MDGKITSEPLAYAFSEYGYRASGSTVNPITRKKGEIDMNNIFYIVGVVVVVLFVAGYLGLR